MLGVHTWLRLTRPQWKWLALSSFLASAISLGVATIIYESYTAILIAFFWTLLSGFHWIYFRFTFITATMIKAIDYPYLAAGALGVFLAAQQGQKDRDVYLSHVDNEIAPPTLDGLKVMINRSIGELCPENTDWKRPEAYCLWVTDLDTFLGLPNALDHLGDEIKFKEQIAEEHHWTDTWANFIYRNPINMPPQRRSEFHTPTAAEIRDQMSVASEARAARYADIILRSLKKIYAQQPTQSQTGAPPALPPDYSSIFYRLIVWPFLFALAGALRFTKVTADVSGFTR